MKQNDNSNQQDKPEGLGQVDAVVMHPIQPLIEDKHGVTRFKANEIVKYLLECGRTGTETDMNKIAHLDFSRSDREQFAQLIGYSLSGASELSYMSEEVLETAETIYISGKKNEDQKDVMIEHLQNKLRVLRENLAEALADFFERHPDDLKGV